MGARNRERGKGREESCDEAEEREGRERGKGNIEKEGVLGKEVMKKGKGKGNDEGEGREGKEVKDYLGECLEFCSFSVFFPSLVG